MSFLDLARARYSERRFAPDPIEPEKLSRILEAARIAPTARNLQPQRVLVVQSPEGLAKIDRATSCRFGAPLVLVLSYDMTVASRHPDVVDFGVVDTAIAATHMMLEAQELGVHSCWVGLIDPPELRRQFGIPRTQRIISIMPLGYPSERSHPAHLHEESLPLEQMVVWETYADHCG
ncbi:MAG TPA: nitroreductase family protein [Candidatus Coprousia avicola]|nr:nitroreductase family protein [Candidatus Coprousia avicola]